MNTNIPEKEIKKLFKKHAAIEPRTDFTNAVMESIGKLSTEKKPAFYKSFQDGTLWLVSAILAIAGISYLFVFVDGALMWSENEPVLYPIFKNVWINLVQIFESIKISSFTIAILFGLFSLILAERIFRKYQSTKGSVNFL